MTDFFDTDDGVALLVAGAAAIRLLLRCAADPRRTEEDRAEFEHASNALTLLLAPVGVRDPSLGAFAESVRALNRLDPDGLHDHLLALPPERVADAFAVLDGD